MPIADISSESAPSIYQSIRLRSLVVRKKRFGTCISWVQTLHHNMSDSWKVSEFIKTISFSTKSFHSLVGCVPARLEIQWSPGRKRRQLCGPTIPHSSRNSLSSSQIKPGMKQRIKPFCSLSFVMLVIRESMEYAVMSRERERERRRGEERESGHKLRTEFKTDKHELFRYCIPLYNSGETIFKCYGCFLRRWW